MKFTRTLAVSTVFFLVAVIAATWLYPQLPATLPVHWNVSGHVDRHAPRQWVAMMPALLIVGCAIMTALLPAISPRRFGIEPFKRTWHIVMLAVQALVLVVGLSMLLAGAGRAVPMPTVAMLAVGALFMLIGNYMGKLRRNFFIGIRTPWTLASAAVWERTHRLGAWLFTLAGLLTVIVVLAGAPYWLAIGMLIAAAFVPCAYSLLVYRRLQR